MINMYWIKRKLQQIRKVFRWLPIIWNTYDWDYRYAIEIFSKQLEDMATFMESDKGISMGNADRGKRIRTTIKLMQKVYNEDYAMEYIDRVTPKYGKTTLNFIPIKDSTSSTMEVLYNGKPETPEIRKFVTNESLQSERKQEKAHRILWEFIAHNIRNWWD